MRRSFLLLSLALTTATLAFAQTPEATATLPPSAADAGKDQVHALNNAFARVFETVAPSVVIIETSKKTDSSENSAFDDLFFQGPPDDTNSRRNQRGMQP